MKTCGTTVRAVTAGNIETPVRPPNAKNNICTNPTQQTELEAATNLKKSKKRKKNRNKYGKEERLNKQLRPKNTPNHTGRQFTDCGLHKIQHRLQRSKVFTDEPDRRKTHHKQKSNRGPHQKSGFRVYDGFENRDFQNSNRPRINPSQK